MKRVDKLKNILKQTQRANDYLRMAKRKNIKPHSEQSLKIASEALVKMREVLKQNEVTK